MHVGLQFLRGTVCTRKVGKILLTIALEIAPGAIYKAGGSFKIDVYELGVFLPLAILQGGENLLFVNSLQVSFEWHSYPLL